MDNRELWTALINQLSFFDDPVRLAAQVNALCDELDVRVKEGVGVAPVDAPRILVTGTPQPLPAWKLHALIEQAGGCRCWGGNLHRRTLL